MKCLILGGGGFLGSHLCDGLLGKGHSVRIFDRPNLQRYRVFAPDECVEWVEGDFVNAQNVSAALAGCEIVFHLVSTTLPRSSNDNPAYDVTTNLVATINLLDEACRQGVRKIIFASSGGTVYGVPASTPIREDHSAEPICSYGICKLAIEKYLRLYRSLHGLDYVVLRLANPYGERQRIFAAQGAVSVFLKKALSEEPIEIWGDGSVTRDYFHVSDAVSAFLMAVGHEGEARIFNIGSGTGRTLNEILEAIEFLLGRSVVRRYLPGRSFDVPTNVLDISLARDKLAWQPQKKFSDGLAQTMAWMKEREE